MTYVFQIARRASSNVRAVALLCMACAFGCGGGASNFGGTLVPPRLDPYVHVFIPPRNDIPPGTVVIVWDKPTRQIDVICRAEDYNNNLPAPPGPPTTGVHATESTKSAAKAGLDLDVLNAIQAHVGGDTSATIEGNYSNVRPATIKNIGGMIRLAEGSAECRKNADVFRKMPNRKVDRIEMVSEALEMTFNYTAKTSHGLEASVEAPIATAIGNVARVQIGGSDMRTVTIEGARVFTNFNALPVAL